MGAKHPIRARTQAGNKALEMAERTGLTPEDIIDVAMERLKDTDLDEQTASWRKHFRRGNRAATSFRLAPSVLEALKQMADEHHTSQAQVMELAVLTLHGLGATPEERSEELERLWARRRTR